MISNYDDVIDSRDVIARIEELREILDEDDHEPESPEWEEFNTLLALENEAKDYSEDWQYGATLIRDSYFTQYAMDLAEDIIDGFNDVSWPYNCIDWSVAADELKVDYTSVDFDGVTYWVR